MRPCTSDGCEKPHRARGYCSSHYNEQHRKPNPTAKFDCARKRWHARAVERTSCALPLQRHEGRQAMDGCSNVFLTPRRG